MIYTDRDAELMKAHAGEPWRPSNSTEGHLFMVAVCAKCSVDYVDCNINLAAFCLPLDDPGYPKEWQIGQNGQPCCTAFAEATHG